MLPSSPSQPTYTHTANAMAAVPFLQVQDMTLLPISEEGAAAASIARGKEMRRDLLAKLRPPPLVHSWDFWHDRQDRQPTQIPESPADAEARYEDRLRHLSSISDVRAFWSTFNNFQVSSLQLRDSIHLFHYGVKPLWEDPRNSKGGSWTFRVPKDKAAAFWKEICMLAVGEQLQAAVASDRTTFRDDICGVSLSMRFTSVLIQVWNRDADHELGINRILATVLSALPLELMPKEKGCYYKRHNEHTAFNS